MCNEFYQHGILGRLLTTLLEGVYVFSGGDSVDCELFGPL